MKPIVVNMKKLFKTLLFSVIVFLFSSCHSNSKFSNIARSDMQYLKFPGYEYFENSVNINPVDVNSASYAELLANEPYQMYALETATYQVVMSTDDKPELGEMQAISTTVPFEGFGFMADVTYKDKETKNILLYIADQTAASFGIIMDKELLESAALNPETVASFSKAYKLDENTEMTYAEKLVSTFFVNLTSATLPNIYHGATVNTKDGEKVRVFGLMQKK
jgi:hypothetical protein